MPSERSRRVGTLQGGAQRSRPHGALPVFFVFRASKQFEEFIIIVIGDYTLTGVVHKLLGHPFAFHTSYFVLASELC